VFLRTPLLVSADVWHTIVTKEEEIELCTPLLQFLERSLVRMSNHTSDEIRRWVPERCIQGRDNANSCCVQCGINHEARDFMRATLLHLLDHFERHDKFIEFMKNHEFLDIGIYETMVTNIEKFQKEEHNTQENDDSRLLAVIDVRRIHNIPSIFASVRKNKCFESFGSIIE
jgi:hypothetical protein